MIGRNWRLLFGFLAAALLTAGICGLAAIVPDYDHVRQTVSEIGEAGSPAQFAFTVLLCLVALFILVFASGVRAASLAEGRSPFAAYVIAAMGVSAAGVGIFSHPHPLHNVFGISELIGYQAPAALALTWAGAPRARGLVGFSWVMFALVWIAIVLNLSSLDPQGPIWTQVKPIIGLVQRALFAAWFGWGAVVSVMLIDRTLRAK